MARKKILNSLLNPLGFTVFRSEETRSTEFMVGNILRFRERLIENHFLHNDAIVKYGPFKGLKLTKSGVWNDGDILTKTIGSYERELHPFVKKIAENKSSALLNIGASDGFYALGMKHLMPDTDVFAYDIDEGSRLVLEASANTNDLSVHILNDFSFAEMEEFRKYVSLTFIIDCEGCEIGLEAIASDILTKATFLVELHEFLVPGVTTRLSDYLSLTHNVTIVDEVPRNSKDYPNISTMSALERLVLLCEYREGPMSWLYATPKGLQ